MKSSVKPTPSKPRVPPATPEDRVLHTLLDLFLRQPPSAEAADYLSGIRFTDAEKQRITEILERNQDGKASPEELAEVDRYLKIDYFLSTLELRMRTALKKMAAPVGIACRG